MSTEATDNIEKEIDRIESKPVMTEWDTGYAIGLREALRLIQEPKHPEDCECPECTGEDRAIAAMEAGIRECENRFEPDSLVRYN